MKLITFGESQISAREMGTWKFIFGAGFLLGAFFSTLVRKTHKS